MTEFNTVAHLKIGDVLMIEGELDYRVDAILRSSQVIWLEPTRGMGDRIKVSFEWFLELQRDGLVTMRRGNKILPYTVIGQ